MRPVSSAYNPYPDERWSNFKVSFRLLDVSAAGDATPTVSQQDAHMTQLPQTHDEITGMSAKWATFEQDGWPLDGSAQLVPDDMTGYQSGWWSGLSGADGVFSAAPTLSFLFSENHSSVGFTVVFDDKTPQYPQSMTITAYDVADAVIEARPLLVTSAYQVIDMPTDNYRRIVLTFGPTQKPYQRVRVSEVLFGILQQYDRHNMTQATVKYEVSPTAETLPSTELSFVFDNIGHGYNMANPSGLYAYIQDGQTLDMAIEVGPSRTMQESVDMGRLFFTVSEASDASATARIVANDPFLRLGDSVCRIGETGTWTLAAAIAAIIADSGRDITTDIPPAIGSRIIGKCIPPDTPHREAIRLAAQAARCTCWFDRDEVLVFRELAPSLPVDAVSNSNMPSPALGQISGRVNTVELTVRDEYLDDSEDLLYTAASVGPMESVQVKTYTNPLAYDGAAVATWLLAMAQYRLSFALTERGNPAREIGDTVTVTDNYGTAVDAVVVAQEYTLDSSGLRGTGKVWRCG